ncbi:hypothetical protein [Methylophaga sp.]|uniref:hypothetical protein n=1 Tax=Methylophaga sp. TaxID=2024840 RepID=UPI003F69D84F
MKVFSFRNIRILILLGLLMATVVYTQEQKRNTTSWYKPINVVIYPINGDGTAETQQYINHLSADNFISIDTFFARSGREYQLIAEQPVITQLGETITDIPPAPPSSGQNVIAAIAWSLKLRYWAYQHTPDVKSNKDRIRLYVLYHQPDGNSALAHSLGLQKGLIGVIHAYATQKQSQQNAVVMTHEILHTVGAIDKYDESNLPVYPEGYAEPDKEPLYPQRFAEIMAGRIAINRDKAKMPESLRAVKVGRTTAQEINWIQ